MSDLFRSDEISKKYALLRNSGVLGGRCALCEEPASTDFKYWKIIPNSYPYDLIAKRHDMLVPKRHVVEAELLPEEHEELIAIKDSDTAAQYDYLFEATNHKKSIPKHFHIHLIVGKKLSLQ